jgi:hypothetical protein
MPEVLGGYVRPTVSEEAVDRIAELSTPAPLTQLVYELRNYVAPDTSLESDVQLDIYVEMLIRFSCERSYIWKAHQIGTWKELIWHGWEDLYDD